MSGVSTVDMTAERVPAGMVALLVGLAAIFAVTLQAGMPLAFLAALAGVVALGVGLLRPGVALLFAIILMPLEVVGRIIWTQPAITWGKVTLLLALLGVLTRMLVRHERFELTPLVWPLFALVAIGPVGSFVGGYGLTFDTFKMAVAMAIQVLFVLLAFNLLRTERQLSIGALAVVGASVPVVVIGLIEIVIKETVFENPMLTEPLFAPGETNVFRITSTFYDPNALSRFLSFSILWSLCALSLPSLKSWRPAIVVMIALQTYCLVNTFSRGGFLATALVGGPLLVAALVRKFKGAGYAIAAGIGAAAAVTLAPLLTILMSRFDDPTAGGRVGIVSASIPVIARSPLVGYGREHIAQALSTVLYIPIDPHNLYTEILLSMGVVGAMIALAWAVPVCMALVREWRAGDPRARLVMAPLIAVLVFGMSLQGFDGYELWVPFAFAMPVLRLAAESRGEALCG